MNDKPDWDRLLGIATEQKGYFTAAQARACGYGWDLLSHRASSGSLTRIHRGLYRLPDFPSSMREEVMAAWLSAGRDNSLVSHESALEIHDLSDVIPHSIHLTVPRSRRGYRGIEGVTIHTTLRPVPGRDLTVREGMKVTSPARSIVDAAEWGTSPEQIEMAVDDALRRGLTTPERLTAVGESRSGRVQRLIRRSIEEFRDAV